MTILHGDCRELLRQMSDASIDSIVTDPPYELGFMGKQWDASGVAYDVTLWRECLRVLKPGGHLLAFGGTRTYHRMAVAIEDAGFEVRDSIHWLYGSGFPKSLDVSKAIDRAAGAEREVVGERAVPIGHSFAGPTYGGDSSNHEVPITTPATDAARQWEGWGTALKPAHEPIVVARKPLIGTVAANVLQHGTGAINVDGCRVHMSDTDREAARVPQPSNASPVPKVSGVGRNGQIFEPARGGRWPANIVFTHAADCGDQCAEGCPVAALDEQSGVSVSGKPRADRGKGGIWSDGDGVPCEPQHGDTGGASRFFTVTEWDVPFRYIAKPSKRERNAGLDELPERPSASAVGMGVVTAANWGDPDQPVYERKTAHANNHPTVKPLALMRWLVRLVTPPGGIVLDPFLGSGTTAAAAVLEGFDWVGCEMTAEYLPIIEGRVAWAHEQAGKPAEARRSDEVLPFGQLDLFGGEAA